MDKKVSYRLPVKMAQHQSGERNSHVQLEPRKNTCKKKHSHVQGNDDKSRMKKTVAERFSD